MLNGRWYGVILLLLAVALVQPHPCAADRYDISRLTVTGYVATRLWLAAPAKTNRPMYLNVKGEWKDLAVEKTATGLSFSLPQDGMARSVIVLDRPAWLVLPDADPPAIEAISVGATATQPSAELIDLGHVARTPASITITAGDKLNPIALDRIQVRINEKQPSAWDGSVRVTQSKDGRHADIIITPGELGEAQHTIVVTVPDAAPTHNAATVQLAFDTMPLIKNGQFEEVDANGRAKHWFGDAWSLSKDTKYEYTAAKGAGRTGNALKINGIAGNLCLLARQQPKLEPGKTYVMTGYYKSDATSGGVLLFTLKDSKTVQSEGQTFEPAAEWTPFEWEFTFKPGPNRVYIYVRSNGKGISWYDDVKLELKE